MASGDQNRSQCCFLKWMNLQQQELSELLQASTLYNTTKNNGGDKDKDNDNDNDNENNLSYLVQKCIKHFQEYADKRSQLARDDVSAFFAPTWCTNWENSLLWIGGCRPSQYIRLVYALSGLEIESQLNEFLHGTICTGNLSGLSAKQLLLINSLQGKTIRAEEKLSSKMASLQEDVADQPIAVIAKGLSAVGDLNGEVDKALDNHEKSMVGILEDADKLRLSTLKELLGVLTTVQGVEFLAASKKLHLCVHEWGKKRDQMHGRGNCNKNIN